MKKALHMQLRPSNTDDIKYMHGIQFYYFTNNFIENKNNQFRIAGMRIILKLTMLSVLKY